MNGDAQPIALPGPAAELAFRPYADFGEEPPERTYGCARSRHGHVWCWGDSDPVELGIDALERATDVVVSPEAAAPIDFTTLAEGEESIF